ncbi:MAG: GNAT family N-acetyltransferase [Kiritimatiellae bacterium]|nr:GNAT family N-acetyltransferase [Kiritimatiellia bacterium]
MDNALTFSLRSARLSDAERIFALIRSHSDLLVPKPMGDIVSSIDRFVVAESAGEIVGCATYSILPEIGSAERATVEVQSVAVSAPFRKSGIGRALVESVLKRIESFNPVDALVLTFAPEFFAKLGFSEIPKSKVMHKLYSGCIHCTKHADPFTCPEIAMSRKI